jgi:hypothetical protein
VTDDELFTGGSLVHLTFDELRQKMNEGKKNPEFRSQKPE